jgi:hypothetical protein
MGASFRNCSGGTHWAINLCAPRIAAGSASRNWRRRPRSHLHQNTASLPLMFEFLRCRRPFPVAHLRHILAIFGHIEPMEQRRRSSFNEIIEEGSAYLAANPKSIQDYEEDNDVEECEYSPGPDGVVVLVASFASLSSRYGQLSKASPETSCTDFGFAESDIPNHPPDHGDSQRFPASLLNHPSAKISEHPDSNHRLSVCTRLKVVGTRRTASASGKYGPEKRRRGYARCDRRRRCGVRGAG